MKPTEDAKMKNDEAGRPMPEAFKDPHHLANTADAMGRLCKSWQGSTAEYHFACRDTIRAQAARIAELEALVAADFDMLDSTWKARAEAAEAEVARLREAVSLTVRADNLREEYHKMPNDKNRIGDKRSRKGHARDAWLRAFRKAARVSRAALQPKEGE